MAKREKEENANILTNPEELKKFKQVLATITHYLQIIDDQKEAIKETVEEASGIYSIDKKIIRKLANVMYKHNYADIQAENEHFELLYESLVGSRVTLSNDLNDSEAGDEEE